MTDKMSIGDRMKEYASFDDMSLRDYFAAKAMTQFIATWPDIARVNGGWIADQDYDQVAKHSYAMADAMLRERDKAREGGA